MYLPNIQYLQPGHLGEGKTRSKDDDCQVEAGQKDVAVQIEYCKTFYLKSEILDTLWIY